MIRKLIVSHGQRERELALVDTIVVGRDPECDVSEDGDSLLSRRHTEFALEPNGVVVRDLGSRNGTFVNGVKTVESPVRPGDVVQVGHLLVRLVEGDTPVSTRTPPPDGDTTRVLRAPGAAAGATSPPPTDDDQTMVLRRPSAGGRSPAAAAGVPARAAEADDDRTIVVKPARPAPASSTARTPAAAGGADAGRSVSVQLALLSGVVFLSGASALVFGTTPVPLWRLAPGLIVAAIATIATATVINRRLARAAVSDDRLSGPSRLGSGTQVSATPEARR